MYKGQRVQVWNTKVPDMHRRCGTVIMAGADSSHVQMDGETHPTYFRNSSLVYMQTAPCAPVPTPVSAPGLLTKAKDLLDERGKTYDPKGKAERSMKKIVQAFNTITGQDLTEVQGWEFMAVLKQVRFFQNESKPHADSLEDLISYSALLGEAALTTTN